MAPEDWHILPFGEFATLQRGFDLPLSRRQFGDVPVLAAGGCIDHHDRARASGPGVVTGRSGTIGKVTYVEDDFWPLNTTLYVKDFHGNLPHFVAYFLEYFDLARFATGTGVSTLNRNRVHQERVVIPGLAEQRRVVDILGTVEAAIEAAQQVIRQDARLGRGLKNQLLNGALGRDLPACNPPSSTASGQLPEPWRMQPLGRLCELRNGHSFRIDDWAPSGLPIIRIQNLNGSRRFKYFAGAPRARWIVEPGDLLFAWAGSKHASLGPTLWSGPRGVLNQHIFRVEPAPGVDKRWLFEVLDQLTQEIASRSRGFKTSLQHLRKADLVDQPVALPPAFEQRLIARHCEHLTRVSQNQQHSLESLLRLRHSLLRDLMTGKVRAARLG